MTSSVYDDRTYTMLCTDENGNLEEDRLAYFKMLKQGHTAIIGPDGNPISEYVPSGKEGLAIAEIDLEKIIDYKYLMDPAGHYSNQSLSMNFNRNPNPVVRFFGDGKQKTISYEEMQPFAAEDDK